MNIQKLQETITQNIAEKKESCTKLLPYFYLSNVCTICEQVNPEYAFMCKKCPTWLLIKAYRANKLYIQT